MELLEIKSDVFGIIDRLKAWNSGYSVFYNLKSKKFMLYLIKNEFTPREYCLTFPFDQIDERMYDLTLKSEVQNQKAYFEEIEKSNALLLKREQKKYLEKMEIEYESKRHN